jgi:predicted RNA-binding protein with PUA-like domain
MNHWLVKQEPESYSWDAFAADRCTAWEGVRNFQARNNLRAMKPGDAVLFYASGDTKAVVGLASVSRAAFPDPSAQPGEVDWVAVELQAVAPLAHPVSLAEIKAAPALRDMLLVRHSRLSVMPVSAEAFATIVALGGGAGHAHPARTPAAAPHSTTKRKPTVR